MWLVSTAQYGVDTGEGMLQASKVLAEHPADGAGLRGFDGPAPASLFDNLTS